MPSNARERTTSYRIAQGAHSSHSKACNARSERRVLACTLLTFITRGGQWACAYVQPGHKVGQSTGVEKGKEGRERNEGR
jgi:hypothetical protein